MQDQLNRIEEKLDQLLESRHEHHGRITKLESEAGIMKWIIGIAISAFGLAIKFSRGES